VDKGKWIARLPQEDFCQALGVGPDQKYEQAGGPGMEKCLQLLQGSADREDTTLFLLTQLAFVLMAATDGHAKNFSIYLDRGDAYRMTPLYDVLSMWPYFGDGASQFRQRKGAWRWPCARRTRTTCSTRSRRATGSNWRPSTAATPCGLR
jgi:serine/threonine-protein kinase HipA